MELYHFNDIGKTKFESTCKARILGSYFLLMTSPRLYPTPNSFIKDIIE